MGVRVYESMTKFEDMDVPACFSGKDNVQLVFNSPAARMMVAQSIPTVYNGLGTVGVAFGENVKYLDFGALENGLILDISAAKILSERGVDVGLSEFKGSRIFTEEYFPDKNQYALLTYCPATEVRVKPEAKIQSYFIDANENRVVGSYTYENADGHKFLVFTFDGYSMCHVAYNDHAFRQYYRGEQINDWVLSLEKRLPAFINGNPDCYMLCYENESEKSVWLGNFFADECMNTTVVLDKEYREIEFINCNGTLEGDKVHLDCVLPYASVGFVVR